MIWTVIEVKEDIFSFDAATVAIKGKRPYQEDNLICSFPIGQESGFAVLADGMGGHKAGDVASALVVAEVFSQLQANTLLLQDDQTDVPAALKAATYAANERVADYTADHQDAFGMGSTLLSILIRTQTLFWISVGDSPLFLYRDGILRQLNEDHSMAPQIDMMVKVGAMTEDAGRSHPDRNTLTAAISGEDIAKIDCPAQATTLLPGDIVIASSDGLQSLTDTQIADTLATCRTQASADIAKALCVAINKRDHPSQDNAAIAVVKIDTEVVTGAQQQVPAPEVETDVEVIADDPPRAEPKIAFEADIPEDTDAPVLEETLPDSSTAPKTPIRVVTTEVPSKPTQQASDGKRRMVKLTGTRRPMPLTPKPDPEVTEDAIPEDMEDNESREVYWYRRHKRQQD